MNIQHRAWVVPKCDRCGKATDFISEEEGLRKYVCFPCRRKILQDRRGIRIYLPYR